MSKHEQTFSLGTPANPRKLIHDSRVLIYQHQELERYLRPCELGVLAEKSFYHVPGRDMVEVFYYSPYIASWCNSVHSEVDMSNAEIACQLYSIVEKCELLIAELRRQADRLTQEADSLLSEQ